MRAEQLRDEALINPDERQAATADQQYGFVSLAAHAQCDSTRTLLEYRGKPACGGGLHTILVLGGYGFFGQRIAASLAKDRDIRLLIGGRHRQNAFRVATSLGLPESHAVQVDANDPALPEVLKQLRVATLIHTAGPFQGQDYTVARAAIAARCNYIDLADGRDFVARIDQLDEAAKAAGVTIVSGASSVPGLSSAVVDHYAGQFKRLDSIRIGIASGARAPGIATVKGVFGYCGKPIRRWENGQWATTYGWLDLQRHRFPDPVGVRFLGSCDVPDLEVFPKRYWTVKTVTFHAGFASSVGHLAVWSLAALTKAHVLPSVTPFAAPLNRMSRWIEPMVSDKGAMFVTLDGIGIDGQPLTRTWHLIASQNHGPFIPCGASIALARKLARGESLPKGAMPCVGLLSIAEYLAPLRDLAILEIPP